MDYVAILLFRIILFIIGHNHHVLAESQYDPHLFIETIVAVGGRCPDNAERDQVRNKLTQKVLNQLSIFSGK